MTAATNDSNAARARDEFREPSSAPSPMDAPPLPLVLVTGCSGLIGMRTARELSSAYRVVGLDVEAPQEQGLFTDFLACDLTDDDAVREALDRVRERHGGRIASVVHLAAYYDFSGAESPLYHDLTVEGTRRLLRALQPFRVEQFVFTSTILVMRPAEDEDEEIDESSAIERSWDYPESKIEAEAVIARERGATPAVILRIAGVYDDLCHCLPVAQQIHRIREKQLESYVFPGDADHGQPYVHLDDLAVLIRHAIERRERFDGFHLYLVAEPTLLSYEALQDRIGELLHGKEWPTLRIPATLAKAGAWLKSKLPGDKPFIQPWMIDLADAHYPVSIERARRELEWSPKRDLWSTLPRMIARLREDPVAWYREHDLPLDDELKEREKKAHDAAAREPSGRGGGILEAEA